jgi:hypothetical protein
VSDSARRRWIAGYLGAALFLASLTAATSAYAQADSELINPVLNQEIVSPRVSIFEMIGIAQRTRRRQPVTGLRLEATDIRSQVVATVAAAFEPGLFRELVIHDGMPSLGFPLDASVTSRKPLGFSALICISCFAQMA